MPTITKYKINTGSHIDELGVRHLKGTDGAVFWSIQNLLKHNRPGEHRFKKLEEKEIDRDSDEYKLRLRGATGESLEGEDIPEELSQAGVDTPEPVDDEVDLFSMTVKELRQYADDNEIDLEDATTKADIISAIQLAEEE